MHLSRFIILTLCILVLPANLVLSAANDSGDSGDKTPTPTEPTTNNDSVVIPKVAPVAKWTFDTPDSKPKPGTLEGKAAIAPAGPQTPTYPAFPAGNQAATFTGKDSSIRVKESELPDDNLRFKQGETITIETWVQSADIANGRYVYLIGKGRNKTPGLPSENQNWALRLKGENGEAKPTFLFRSRTTSGEENSHRWVAKDGFTPGPGWHHVAVTYTFGKPDSISGYIDGKKISSGTWDMAGKTTAPPVHDADDILIGTGNGGGPGNTLNGALDEIAIYRKSVPGTTLAQRFQFMPPPPTVDPATIPDGKVLVQICEENIPRKNAWPDHPPQPTETYQESAFGFFELPQKYIDTGIRADRPNPSVIRAAAKVEIPVGKHRLLMRGRGAARLHINGKQTLTTPFPKNNTSAHNLVSEQDKFLDLGDPNFRWVQPGDSEAWIEFESQGGSHLIIYEQMVGGMVGRSNRRPELGESIVAISLQGTQTWQLLTPGTQRIDYPDTAIPAYRNAQLAQLTTLNQKRRAELRQQHAPYWNKRREAAQQYLTSTKDIPVPAPTPDYPANNAIDHFINSKIATVATQYTKAKKDGVNFYREVLPILEANCYSCHQGTKTKGDLVLDNLASALIGGESDGPAITPGKAAESSLFHRVTTTDEDYIMPPKGHPLTAEQIDILRRWIDEGAVWPELNVERIELTDTTSDLHFLRRITLDTIGIPPTLKEIEAFLADTSKDKRAATIDRLLADPRWADRWMGYWQDVLAENPNILNPTLNNTGPFRFFLHESLSDDKPFDLFVTELLRMRGSNRFGGPAGFGIASQNDVPMAAKGTIVSTAFLGIEMKCARCHDSPAHESSQQDLFELGAMMQKASLDVPTTSSVPIDKLHEGGRKPLIQVTLNPGTKVDPAWPFEDLIPAALADTLAETPTDTRDRLATLITAPQNQRFAQVIANRVWKELMGRGIINPVEDWEKGKPTHPELLAWLGREFTRQNYSLKNLSRLIFNSHAYQRATDPALREASPLFTAPAPRRLSAEQIVDSAFAATGKPMRTEEISLDIDGRRDMGSSLNLGLPNRAWELTSTSNERDRPSLALPRIQAINDVLQAFGWRGSRQDPLSTRDLSPSALQPAILSNGTMAIWLTRLSDDHGITQLALKDQSVEQLIDTLFLQLLTRKPTAEERETYIDYLSQGYDTRIFTGSIPVAQPKERRPEKYVTWTNHLDAEANVLRQQQEVAARKGDPPTNRLTPEWRLRMEDTLWALLNAPETVFAP
ncbi:DUF1553 domain-containing protein [Phragmitibacter flavus]|uniref:DUF1553 domain-containing protein n=1 Tax=Phragmitibacter flavus TaxID=2576071 RepID=A0A5R8KB97_9BACT|nr:DUF1553 domain-containing protein [Phragmitibacter flavus]TLD69527.1 DUF1553 domain-containing protein [Phragmitibacter flavus]